VTQATDKTLAEIAYKRIREDLLAGSLGASTRLRVNELKERYGLGLSPLREALLKLTSEGFVIAEGQRGFADAPLSLGDLADITQTRQHIEAIALSESIDKGDADWEAAIMSAFHRLSRAPLPNGPSDAQAILNWEQKHRAFHDSLIVACASPWMIGFHSQLVDHSERYRRARLFSTVPATQIARDIEMEHRAIMESVLSRDKQRACELMRDHLQRTATAAAQGLQREKNGAPKI
jgi:DNA-binding GntR family transcriptional regulator